MKKEFRAHFLTKVEPAPKAENEDGRSFDFVCSTSVRDRNGRIVVQDWNLEEYIANPVVFWNHMIQGDGWSMDSPDVDMTIPIGRASNVRLEDDKLCARIHFVTVEANPLAEKIYQSVLQKSVNAVSVGWWSDDVTYEMINEECVAIMRSNTLFEISPVGIPANPQAVRAAFRASVDAFAQEKNRMPLNPTKLRASLRLSAAATDEEVMSKAEEIGGIAGELDTLSDKLKKAIGVTDSIVEETGETTPESAKAAIRGLKAKAAAYDKLVAETATEKAAAKAARASELIRAGLAEGKLTPANRTTLLVEVCGASLVPGTQEIDVATVDPDRLQALLKNLPVIVAKAGGSREHANNATGSVVSLTDSERATAKRLGVSEEEFAAEKAKVAARTTRRRSAPSATEDDQ